MFYWAFVSLFVCLLENLQKNTNFIFMKILPTIYLTSKISLNFGICSHADREDPKN